MDWATCSLSRISLNSRERNSPALSVWSEATVNWSSAPYRRASNALNAAMKERT